MESITAQQIKSAYARLKYPLNKGVNVLSIRNSIYNTNDFNDLTGFLAFPDTPQEDYKLYRSTTDPGEGPLSAPRNPAGTAVLRSGFYANMYILGNHKGKKTHPCLRQYGKAIYYRVKERTGNIVWDPRTLVVDIIGSNIHGTSARYVPDLVDDYSESCQVIQNWESYLKFLKLVKTYAAKYNQHMLDYALFQEKELVL